MAQSSSPYDNAVQVYGSSNSDGGAGYGGRSEYRLYSYRGRDNIDRIAGAVKATHPDFRYQPIAEPEEVGDERRGYTSGSPSRNTGSVRLQRPPCRPAGSQD